MNGAAVVQPQMHSEIFTVTSFFRLGLSDVFKWRLTGIGRERAGKKRRCT